MIRRHGTTIKFLRITFLITADLSFTFRNCKSLLLAYSTKVARRALQRVTKMAYEAACAGSRKCVAYSLSNCNTNQKASNESRFRITKFRFIEIPFSNICNFPNFRAANNTVIDEMQSSVKVQETITLVEFLIRKNFISKPHSAPIENRARA